MRLHFFILFLIYFILIQINCQPSESAINEQYDEIDAIDVSATTSPVSSTTHHVNHHKNRKQRIKTGKKHKIIHRKIQNFRPQLTTKQITDHIKESTEFIFTKNNHNQFGYQDTEEVNDQNVSNDINDAASSVKITDLTVKVGDTAYLKCAINSTYGSNPGVIWMQGKLGSVLTLNTNRITVDTRFEIVQLPLDSQQEEIENSLIINSNNNNNNKRDGQVPLLIQSQLPELSYYHLKIVNVQLFDENEYACETSITKNNDDQPSLHSLIRLHVTRKGLI